MPSYAYEGAAPVSAVVTAAHWPAVNAAVTTNVNLAVAMPDALGGVRLASTWANSQTDYVLLAGQTTASQNGIYQPDASFQLVDLTTTPHFDGSGAYSVAVTAGIRVAIQLAAGESLVAGAITYTGDGVTKYEFAAPASGTMVLHGTASAAIASEVRYFKLTRADDRVHASVSADFTAGKQVSVLGGTNSGLWQYTAAGSPTIDTTALTFALVIPKPASFSPGVGYQGTAPTNQSPAVAYDETAPVTASVANPYVGTTPVTASTAAPYSHATPVTASVTAAYAGVTPATSSVGVAYAGVAPGGKQVTGTDNTNTAPDPIAIGFFIVVTASGVPVEASLSGTASQLTSKL